MVSLRAQAQSAQSSGNEKARIDAENQISKNCQWNYIAFEAYPDLKAKSKRHAITRRNCEYGK